MLRISALLFVAIILTACSSLQQQNNTPLVVPEATLQSAEPVEPVDQDNPYDIIDEANRHLFSEPGAEGPPEPEGKQPIPVIWDRLVAGFTLPECTPGSTAHEWQEWYGNHNDYMQRVFVRARPWLYDIMMQIEERDLPYELALLPIVESAYDTFAFSSAAAVGGWQFTAPTARDYGLKINTWYDGRRDMYAATRAALNYLQVLFNRFEDNWRLALAGYNAGGGRVNRAVTRHGGDVRTLHTKDLRLPRETLGFAPKLHGLSCLLRNPGAYQLKLPPIPDIPLITAVNLEQPIDLVYTSQLIDLPISELYALNPGLNRWSTPPDGPHRLILPAGKADVFLQATQDYNLPEASPEWQTITVQSGDTLGQLARRHDTTLALLREHNSLRNDRIFPGQILRTGTATYTQLPGYAETLAELQKLQEGLVPASRTSHRIRSGESLSTIAQQYNVSVRNLQRWNNLSNPNRIRAGQNLVVLAPVRQSSGNRRYRVQPGDSLWRIANRHQITVEALRNLNKLPNGTILQPGQVLLLAPQP